MLDALKQIIPDVGALDPFVIAPDWLALHFYDGATILVVLLALAGLVLIGKACVKSLEDRFKQLLGREHALAMVLLYVLPLGLALASGHYWAGVLLAAVGAAACWNPRHLRGRLLCRWGILAQVIVFTCAFQVETWFRARQYEGIHYYVVLAFDRVGKEDENSLRDLSELYLRTLRDTFKGVPSVRVVPDDPKRLGALSLKSGDQQVARRVLAQLNRPNFCPAVVIRNQVRIPEEKPLPMAITLWLDGVSKKELTLWKTGTWAQSKGKVADIRYFALVAGLELLERAQRMVCRDTLEVLVEPGAKGQGTMRLPEAEEARVRRSILEAYEEFLVSVDSRSDLRDEVGRARAAAVVTNSDVRRLLMAYAGETLPEETKLVHGQRCVGASKLGLSC